MFVHMPLYLRSIAGAPSNRALSGYPITVQHLCVKYHKPGEGVGGDFDHSSVSSVEMRQKHLDFSSTPKCANKHGQHIPMD